jgi:hypothetical protein
VAENKKPGSATWQITSSGATGFIAGFASLTYAMAGQVVPLYISTSASTYTVTAYRMGYYQGLGARQIWQSQPEVGVNQPSCPLTAGVNMVSCDNWTKSLTMTITKTFPQGDYLLKLVGTGNQQSYIVLTVWDPNSTAAYLVMERSLTEEGWNTYGGYSFYTGTGPCTLGQTTPYPICNRAREVSFDRPYATENGAADFIGSEYPLVRFLEQHGLDVSYVTDITVNDHPSILLHHSALLSLDHDETWTYPELSGAKAAVAAGMNLAFLGAAPIVRHARLEASTLGPDRVEVNYRNPAEDPLDGHGSADTVTGNTWATPPTSYTVTSFVGSKYSGFVHPTAPALPFVVYTGTSWIFAGTGLHKGDAVQGVIASDINHLNPAEQPANTEVLGHSPLPLSAVYTNQGSWTGYTYADMTYYTSTSEAGIFSSGTVNWSNAINPCATTNQSCTNTAVAQITGNLLAAMGSGPMGTKYPPNSNWRSVLPAGS